jgi:hypothetical protein
LKFARRSRDRGGPQPPIPNPAIYPVYHYIDYVRFYQPTATGDYVRFYQPAAAGGAATGTE